MSDTEIGAIVGDRVKLIGSHRYAGWTGVFVYTKPSGSGREVPYVKLDQNGHTTIVFDPETQMRKL